MEGIEKYEKRVKQNKTKRAKERYRWPIFGVCERGEEGSQVVLSKLDLCTLATVRT